MWALALAVLTALRLAVAGAMPLSPDEAYYWTWSHALAPGYLDHPPMVAWWIRAGTALVGETPLGVRLLAPISAALGSLLLVRAGDDLLPGVGVRAAVLFNATLIMAAGSVTMTPDTPLLFFWVLALALVARIVRTGAPAAWLGVGASCGLALLSKYTAVLFGAGLAAWLLTDSGARRWLWAWQLWAGGLVAAALFAPVLEWNWAHGWVSFVRQGGRAADFAPSHAVRFLFELMAGQVALATPLVFALCVYGVARACRQWRTHALLACLTLAPLAVFAQHALGDRVQANWPAILYPSAAIAAAGIGRLWRPAAALGFALAVPIYIQASLAPAALPRSVDLTLTRLGGWDPFAREVEASRRLDGAAFVVGEPYGLAAELAWGGLPVLAVEPRWAPFAFPRVQPGAAGLLLQTERRSTPPDAAPWASMEPAGRIVRSRAGVEAEAFRVYRVVPRPGLTALQLPARQESP